MLIRGGFNLAFDCDDVTPIILTIRVRPERAADLVEPEKITLYPEIPVTTYQDGFGNIVTRLVAPPGRLSIWNRFVISDTGLADEMPVDAVQHPVQDLPDDVLVYLIGSRYCDTQKLSEFAWGQFGTLAKGWPLLKAIVQYAHDRIGFDYMQARNDRTAWDAHHERIGVCRDYAHLAVTLCRCMNIPARYCTGYLGDIGVPPDPMPMDFSAWFQVYMDGRWFTMDARHNQPRIGRILMACGRDAADVAISNSFGHNTLAEFSVITDEI